MSPSLRSFGRPSKAAEKLLYISERRSLLTPYLLTNLMYIESRILSSSFHRLTYLMKSASDFGGVRDDERD